LSITTNDKSLQRKNTHRTTVNSQKRSGNSSLDSPLPAIVLLHHQNKLTTLKTKAMKTANLFSALCLVFVLAGVNRAYSSDGSTDKPQITKQTNIRYEVNVYLFSRIDLCNTYLIQVTDETGRLVAPAKIFVPGKQSYIFSETGPATGKLRVAMLVLAPDIDPYVCSTHLGARPDVKIGPFVPGQTYPFVLRPILTAPLDKN
jgi:hypothetical protein